MHNQLFVPDFLFDFYSNRGSIGTPSALSNVSRAGLKISRKTDSDVSAFVPILITRYRKSRKRKKFSAVW